jgi:rubrerythrin
MIKREWDPVAALACPNCGALVIADEAEERCWSCDKKSNLPNGHFTIIDISDVMND